MKSDSVARRWIDASFFLSCIMHTGCRRMQTVYRLARFSVSPRINRIRGIVGTYNEASSRLLSNFCITSPRGKGSFRHRFFAASASPSPPFQRETRTICTAVTRGVRIFLFCASLFARNVCLVGSLHFLILGPFNPRLY